MKNTLVFILLLICSQVTMADTTDDCWKLLKPFVGDARVRSVEMVTTGRYKKYQSINFWLSKKVLIWQTRDWDAMPRDAVSCKFEDGILTHEYGSISDMKTNQSRVNSDKEKTRQEMNKRFK